ncbi:helix-turn-helix domain-containing protein [Ruegeria arenilitoris]|uniref:Anaerobic benzoate catabolism transcriptional regulator n=1 Tax=Ruegeria arenilitoris TaxID=1173585 RepID=A0A238JVQ9_9RHOB|nr:helix-turn-helix transcriptional regulator [Ruegeria arenilitoris]SMX34685.1 anaerobic benzoate catabolism transcriptional regulator [Ruegeria arenilitoris]
MRLRIKEARLSKGLKQEDVAERIGLSRSYFAQLESGTRQLTPRKQVAIAEVLGVNPTDLVDFSAPDKDDEALLIEAFRSLSPEQRKAWLEWARVAIGSMEDAK